jgi:hypothetical protein
MTKFKVYRVSGSGYVSVEIVEAVDWVNLFQMFQYSGNPIFKVEVFGGPEVQV